MSNRADQSLGAVFIRVQRLSELLMGRDFLHRLAASQADLRESSSPSRAGRRVAQQGRLSGSKVSAGDDVCPPTPSSNTQ